jgi:hypothetical protein
MKKVVFENKLFHILLVSLIFLLIGYNAFTSITSQSIYGIIPICIEILLLVLIFTNNRYAKSAILIWSSISLIVSCGFEIVADLIDYFNAEFKASNTDSLLYNIVGLIIGILIVDYARRTIVIASIEEDLDN